MAKKKGWKKTLKKVGKAAAIAGALYAGSKALGKRRLSKAVSGTDDAGLGVSHFKDYITKKPKVDHFDPNFLLPGSKDGGRISKKHGGRTGKQFGGGLGSTARRDMRSGYYPSDMGMRGGTMYKKGGRVKSMGIAKRGGGVAKR
jgi:hypothetical protein